MRILFAGSADIALPSLAALAKRHDVAGILTNPDAVKGRGRGLCCTSVAGLAGRLLPGVPVFRPEKLDGKVRDAIQALKTDILVVFAYGKIFGPKFLALFPKGGVNAHPSLLPRWRGCSPIQSAILFQDAETGVTIQRIALELDSGNILAQTKIQLTGRETSGSLHEIAAAVGADLLLDVLSQLESGTAKEYSQNSAQGTYSRLITKDDGLLDFQEKALDIDARIRAFSPWPGAFAFWNGIRLNIIDAVPYSGPVIPPQGTKAGCAFALDKSKGILVQTGEGILAVSRLQLETKKPLPFKDFLNGNRGFLGSVLVRKTLDRNSAPKPEKT